MGLAAWITVSIVILVILAIMSNRIGPDVAMLGGLTLMMFVDQVLPTVEIITPIDGISGFAHPAIVMIAGLFIVAAGMSETGAAEMIAQRVLGMPKSLGSALVRLMVPVAAMSAFMNNTAVVAMYMPIVSDWSQKLRISPSKFFIPLSFAAILGGTCTMIATASNVTVSKLYEGFCTVQPELVVHFNLAKPEFWWVSLVGVPISIAGMVFIVIISRVLLPERVKPDAMDSGDRQYQVEMVINSGSPIIGKTIEEAGLRHLPGLFLARIERGDDVIPAVGPDELLHENDRLAFVGILKSVIDLKKIRGLVPATDEVKKVRAGRRSRTAVEAVISGTSPLVGKTVRAARFRTVYNAAIIAVHRSGHLVEKKIGDIVLQPGDVLLLETHVGFVDAYRNSRDFYLVSAVEGAREIRHERAWLSLGILGLMVALLVFTSIDKIVAILCCAGLMVLTRCCTGTVARRSISVQVLVVIAAAIGMGKAMENTGAAEALADVLLSAAGGLPPRGMLFVIFMLTSIFAQLVTNNGAAVLMFPIAMRVCTADPENLISPEPFVIAIMIAAACNFMTPVTYQTNLMVYGLGGYRFFDFVKIGVPLTIVVGILSVLLTPVFFGF